MLKIITEGKETDIFDKTEITLVFNNPMLADDGIPVPYSFSFEVPKTNRNLLLYGYPDRPTVAGGGEARRCQILFGGIIIASGQQTVESVGDVISVNFNGAVLPDNIQHFLYKQDLGELTFGGTGLNPLMHYSQILEDLSHEEYPYMVAPPMGITGSETLEAVDARTDINIQRKTFINNYDPTSKYLWNFPPSGYLRDGYLSKILPAFQVGWLLDRLYAGNLQNNLFLNQSDLKRVMLISRWHPLYQGESNAPMFEWGAGYTTGKIKYADFMPGVAASDFTREVLKIPCATLFVQGETYVIERNSDILAGASKADWSDKIIGIPQVSMQAAQEYIYGYSENYGESPTVVMEEVDTIYDMFAKSTTIGDSVEDFPTYYVKSTKQAFTIERDTTSSIKFRFSPIWQKMGSGEEAASGSEERDREAFENALNGSVLMSNLRRYFKTSSANDMSNTDKRQLYYMPQGGEIEKTRPKSVVLGLYYGRRSHVLFPQTAGDLKTYPYLTHCNYDAYGNRLGSMTLQFDGDDGLLNKYHREFKSWTESDRHVLTADVKLSAMDIHNLDLRRKVHVRGKNYLIRTLSITFEPYRIKPAEVELIEVPDVLS